MKEPGICIASVNLLGGMEKRDFAKMVLRNGWIHCGLALLLLALGVFLRIKSFQGYVDSDPAAYVNLAADLAHGSYHVPGYDGPPVFPLRIGIYGPVALIFYYFKTSEAALAVYPFIISVLSLGLAYSLGRFLFSPLAGLLALFFLSIIPVELTYASCLYPDAIACFWGNLGIFALIISLQRGAVAAAFLGGCAIGISWLCKESVVYMVLPLVLLMLLHYWKTRDLRQVVRSGMWMLVPVVLIGMLEGGWYLLRTGDLLFRFHETERNYRVCSTFFFDSASVLYGWSENGWFRSVAVRLFVEGPKELLFNTSAFGWFPLAGGLVALYALSRKLKGFYIASVWLLAVVFTYNFASSSLTSYKPLVLMERYVYPIILPSIILIAGAIASLWNGSGNVNGVNRRISVILGLTLLCVVLAPLPAHIKPRMWFTPEYAARVTIGMLRHDALIFSNYRTAGTLQFLRSQTGCRNGKIAAYEGLAVNNMPVGAYVLVDKAKTIFLEKAHGYKRELYEDRPPQNWAVVWNWRNDTLYHVK